MGTNNGGILVSLGGGTDTTMVPMDSLDVFDLSSRTWSKQSTKGTVPSQRVNPCAVLASSSAAKAIYMYGGQNVLDPLPRIWILALPSFTWVSAGTLNNGPSGRSGHRCHAIGTNMLVFGGYTGSSAQCDSPGIYVFDMSSLSWQSSFQAGKSYSMPSSVSSATGGSTSDGGTPSDQPSGTQTTMLTTTTGITTLPNGQTSMITATLRTTATITSTAPPSAGN